MSEPKRRRTDLDAYLQIIRKLTADSEFRTRFLEAPDATLVGVGVELSAERVAALTDLARTRNQELPNEVLYAGGKGWFAIHNFTPELLSRPA